MTNVPPPPGSPAPKKGLSTGAKVAIGCVIALVLAGIVVAGALMFGAYKAKQYVDSFEEQPVTSAAKAYAAVHPDIEFVEADEETERITFRSKETGETVTVDWAEMKEGRISFETAEGKTTIQSSEGEDGGTLTMEGPEGTATFKSGGASEDDVPAWVFRYPGAEISGAYTATSGGSQSGAFTLTTDDGLEDVVAHFRSELESGGYEIQTQSFSGAGRELRTLQGENAEQSREIAVTVTQADGTTQASVTYKGPAE